MRRNPDKPCEFCGAFFHPYRKALRFCSNTCASRAQYVAHSRSAICVQCGTSFVSRNKDNGSGRHWTKCCSRECAGKLAFRGGGHASRIRRRYGMEPEEYNRRLKQQNGGCLMCDSKPDYPLYVDHDHRTKRNRGLLCARCNTIAGVFDELEPADVVRFWGYCNPAEALAVAYQETTRDRGNTDLRST